MPLVQSLIEIAPSAGIDPESGAVIRSTYGYDISFTHTTLPVDYRSVPHAHESEEVFEVYEGELSVYLEGLEFRLGPSDLLRIPALAPHWKVNKGSTPVVMHEFNNLPRAIDGSASLLDPYEREDSSYGAGKAVRFGRTYRVSRYVADGEESFPVAPDDHYLLARGKPLWDGALAAELPRMHGSEGTNRAIMVAGERFSILYAERVGLKARPHHHAAEQLSYVVSGEVWTFIEDRVLYAAAGDVIRVPGNIIHWALVEPGKTAVTFEVHTPLQGDPVAAAKYGRRHLVPEHRIPNLSWIPGGFPTDALPAEELEEYEAALIAAERERLSLKERAPAAGVTATGSRR